MEAIPMRPTALSFFTIVFCALALVPTGAHVLELIHKIDLPADRYLTVQQLYAGWAWLGTVVMAALLSTFALTVTLRGRAGFMLALVAFLCIAGTQIIFWTVTYPANVATHNWTVLPENWQTLRVHWECSHAASACLNLGALLAATLAVLRAT